MFDENKLYYGKEAADSVSADINEALLKYLKKLISKEIQNPETFNNLIRGAAEFAEDLKAAITVDRKED